MKKLGTKGFSTIEAIFIVTVIALLAGTGYYVWHIGNASNKTLTSTAGNNQTNSSSMQKPASPANPYVGWKTYTSGYEGLSFKYPGDWTLDNEKGADPNGNYISLISPSKFVVTFSVPLSGIGGACDPKVQPHVFFDQVTALNVDASSPLYMALLNWQGYKELAVIDSSVYYHAKTPKAGDTGSCLVYPAFIGKSQALNPDLVQLKTGKALENVDSTSLSNNVTDAEYLSQPDVKTAELIFKSLSY